LALVADALALVGLGRAHLADLGRGLADELLVDPADDDLRRRRHLELDPLPRHDPHRVRVADLQLEVRAGERRAVADPLELEALLEALGDAVDHVRDERAREPVERPVLAALGRARHRDDAVLLRDRDPLRHDLAQLALRTVYGDPAGIDRDGHAGGHLDWSLSDPAHLVTTRSR